jgi:hypothetical protein
MKVPKSPQIHPVSTAYPCLLRWRYISHIQLKRFSTQGVGMRFPTTRGIIIAEMLISVLFIGSLVLCDAYVHRVWIGVGGAAVVPAMVYAGAMRIKKIGYDSGETKIIAEILREHTRLHGD